VPWVFGEAPLPETVELATVLRRLTGTVLSLEGPDPRVAQLTAQLAELERQLAAAIPPSARPRVGADVESDGRVYLDHSVDIGAYNPCFPLYDITVAGEVATGTVEFPIAYEGPPGYVHGGFLGVFFDLVVQHHNCELGVAGKTTEMAVRFRRPTPLLTTLAYTIERRQVDDRIESHATLSNGEKVCAEAQVQAIAGVRADLPPVSPRRVAP
jgi:hypothetical protein